MRRACSSKQGTGMVVAMQGFEEWQVDTSQLGKAIGILSGDKEMLLVYEFMQKGSLKNHLFRRNASTESLLWDIRLKTAIGAAKGLAFLHASDSIYRNFKASDILLDGSFNAKISYFGLEKLGPSGGNSHVTTRVMETYGYAVPEYIATGNLYVKSDVYGYGILLLELLTGLRALDIERAHQNLVYWMKPLLSQEQKLKTIMDARLQGQYSSNAAAQAAQLPLRCLEQEPRKRPPMKEVAEVLEQIAEMEKPKVSKSSRLTHSASSSLHHKQSPRPHHSRR